MLAQDIYHKSVLVDEVIAYLAPQDNGTYVDVTFGGGGHTRAILEANAYCKVIAIDWDTQALEKNGQILQETFPGRLQLIWANFDRIDMVLKKKSIGPVDGIIADFGTSQYQLGHRAGFSFFKDTPLDMRMSPSHQKVTAAQVLNKSSLGLLYTIFKEYGEEPRARFFSKLIVETRKAYPFRTTRQLAQLAEKHTPPQRFGKKIHPATKLFQGLRIYVNNELNNIKSFLPAALRVLNSDGRLICISFHSLEDRIVKDFFKQMSQENKVKIITPKVVLPTKEELQRNLASRSARLRVAQLI